MYGAIEDDVVVKADSADIYGYSHWRSGEDIGFSFGVRLYGPSGEYLQTVHFRVRRFVGVTDSAARNILAFTERREEEQRAEERRIAALVRQGWGNHAGEEEMP